MPIKSYTVWHGPDVLAEVNATAFDNLLRAVSFYHTKLLEEVNVSNPRPYDSPSAPGEPPRKRTGFLQRNILYEVYKSAQMVRVGVSLNALYGLFLEFGTRFMQPRPWLLATLDKYWQQIKALASNRI